MQQAGTIFNLAAGADDALHLANLTPPFSNLVTVMGVEYVFGASTTHDTINVVNDIGMTQVTGGFGADMIDVSASGAFDTIRFTSVQDSYNNAAERDVVVGFDPSGDAFLFDGMAGQFASAVNFIEGDFDMDAGTSEARLVDIGDGNQLLEIDVDGDGVIGASDMTVELRDLSGPLHNGVFQIT